MSKGFGAISRSHASHGAEKSSPPIGFDRGEKLRVLSLFAGIGGFDLGLERTGGFETVAFCEIDPFCQRVLAKHWPGVPCYDDVRQLTAARLKADGIIPDAICGGFPCQDISSAGARAGIAGERSGLWGEFARIIGEIRPSFVIVENVADLLHRGLGRVLGDLAAIGFDAEWHCIPASAVGAPHRRDRIWIIAYPDGKGQPTLSGHDETSGLSPARYLANADGKRLQRAEPVVAADRRRRPTNPGRSLAHAPRQLLDRDRYAGARGRVELANRGWWEAEPAVGRVVDGLPGRTHRLKGLGNAVVPQIPELIGNAILASLAEQEIAA